MEHKMEKKSLMAFLITLIVFASISVTPLIGIEAQDDNLKNMYVSIMTPSVGIDVQDTKLKEMQCYGYGGC